MEIRALSKRLPLISNNLAKALSKNTASLKEKRYQEKKRCQESFCEK